MLNRKSYRLTVAVVAAAVLIVAAGGVAIASNMGFKINMAFAQAVVNTNKGKNDLSLPYNNPYTLNCTTPAGTSCVGALCIAEAFPGGLGGTVITDLINTGPTSGNFRNTTCPAAGAIAGASFGVDLVPGRFVRVRAPVTYNPGSIIIVGSHNPTTSVTVLRVGTTGFVNKTWFAPPYHTTAVTSIDVCRQAGLKLTLPAGTITTLDPVTGTFSNAACSATTGSNLILGRGIQLTQPNVTGATDVTFIPAHF